MNTLHSLFNWTLDVSLRASLLAGAVLCIQAALRGRISARWRYAMWLPVLFVLVAPVLPESRWSAEQMFAPQVTDVVTADSVVEDATMMAMPLPSPVTVPLSSVPASIDWQQLMVFAWAAGVALAIVGGFGIYLLEMRRFRRSAVPVSQSLMTLTQCVACELNLRREPSVWMSPRVTSPAVAGLWRPVVLLPVDFEAAFTHAEAELVLRHELMHLKRWDLPLNALFCFLQALHWFNPLLWFVAARVRQDRETACDSQVLASSERDCRMDYGLALLKVQAACPPHGFCLGLVGMFGNHAAVRSRITAIARYQRAHPAKGLLVATIIGCLGALGATRAEAPNFHIGATDFAKGDSIHITSVNRSDTLIAVSGDYELASQDEAILAFFITAREQKDGSSKTDPQQRIMVKKGKGTFTLIHPHPHPGMPHVSYYPVKGGKVIGGIYFGTKEEAEASKFMTLHRESPKAAKTTSQAPAPTGRPVASVDGQVIFDSELEEARKAQHQMILYKQRDNPAEAASQLAKLGTTVLDSLIDRELVLAEFKKMGGAIKPATVENDVEGIIKAQFKGDRDALTTQLAKQGLSLEKFRETREKMMIVQVMRSKFSGKPEPATQAEIEAYFTAHAEQFTGKPLESVKADIEKTIKSERSAAEVEKWLAGLRAKASIKRF